MKKFTTILMTVFATVTFSFGQITTTKVISNNIQIDKTPYDSLENFLGKDVYKYIGQKLYLKGVSESLRKFGYDGFCLDYTEVSKLNKSNIYKCCDSYNSKYDELSGKYFIVLDIIKHPKASENEFIYGKKFYLKLQEKESKDIVYFEYDSQFEHTFPFIVVGYFEKTKKIYIGKVYVLRGRNWEDEKPEMYDIKSGKSVDFSAGTIWKCVDFTVEEKFYYLSLILENIKGEQLAFSVDRLDNNHFLFLKSDYDKYKKKFGAEYLNLIVDRKVKIGMTKEMCELSWGEPKSINETITTGKKTEQWVYKDNYLYFDNGILTAIQ